MKSFYINCGIIVFALILCAYNFNTGFGEDHDSLRLIYGATKSVNANHLTASRSWGFPLYEIIIYKLLLQENGILFAKIFSLLFLAASIIIFNRILRRINVPATPALLFGITFVCNPLIIIAGNSLIETSMSLFSILLTINYGIKIITNPGKLWHQYIIYGALCGISTLIRPDNLLYFFALLMVEMMRTNLNVKMWTAAMLISVSLGILPYFMLEYPIFHHYPTPARNHFLYLLKNLVCTFGLLNIPLLVFILFKMRKSSTPINRYTDGTALYLNVIIYFAILRWLLLPDEIEYGIIIWPAVLLLIAQLSRSFTGSIKQLNVWLVAMAICTFLPNLWQVYFIDRIGTANSFSAGIGPGVFAQERYRREYNSRLLHFKDSVNYLNEKFHLGIDDKTRAFTENRNCENCIVISDLKVRRDSNDHKADSAKRKFIFVPEVSESRGRRNLLPYKRPPTFIDKNLRQIP
ncbi:MAG: hypothetical protein ABWZ25_15055 [Chitinophagaceae bacterium]